MPSIPRVAYDHELDVIDVINAAKKLGYEPWLSPEQAAKVVQMVSSRVPLDAKEVRSVEDFLLRDERAKKLLGQYVGVEGIVSKEEGEEIMDSISRRLLDEMGGSFKAKLKPKDVYRIIMNLGIIEVHRSVGGTNDLESFVEDCVAPYSPRLASRLLTRYYLNKIQIMKPQEAEQYVQSLRKRVGDDV